MCGARHARGESCEYARRTCVERLDIAHGDRYAIRPRQATETAFTDTGYALETIGTDRPLPGAQACSTRWRCAKCVTRCSLVIALIALRRDRQVSPCPAMVRGGGERSRADCEMDALAASLLPAAVHWRVASRLAWPVRGVRCAGRLSRKRVQRVQGPQDAGCTRPHAGSSGPSGLRFVFPRAWRALRGRCCVAPAYRGPVGTWSKGSRYPLSYFSSARRPIYTLRCEIDLPRASGSRGAWSLQGKRRLHGG